MKETSVVIMCLTIHIISEAHLFDALISNNANLGAEELITEYGYPVETHIVQTKDGYLLTIHRIPNLNQTNAKSPVFIQHGILSSTDDFVITGPDHALAYMLSDVGHDVWMGNARGNAYSTKHTKFNASDSEFWNFSWHEMGVYDLPAMIDYVLNVTSTEKLYFIGHSQGTTSFYVMTSKIPEYNQKIRLMVNLAPVAFMSHVVSPLLRIISIPVDFFKNIIDNFGNFGIFPRRVSKIKQELCKPGAITQPLCYDFQFLLFGFDFGELNLTVFADIMSHVPAGSSAKQLFHYGQLVESGKFREFDHGIKNLVYYGHVEPPEYNLQNVNVPVALFYSNNDWVSAIEDVQILSQKLPNVVMNYEISYLKFNHLDYLYAKDVRSLVYNKILHLLQEF